MRSFLIALVLAAVPGIASAECTCTCNGGQPTPVCTLTSDVAPICQRICLSPVTQSIYNPPVVVPLSSGNLVVSAAPAGTSTDPAALAAGTAAGLAPVNAAGSAVGNTAGGASSSNVSSAASVASTAGAALPGSR